MRNRIDDLIREAADALHALCDAHRRQIEASARLVSDALRAGGAVFICGNGGSAADAQHIAAELAGRYLQQRRALNCTALTTNTSNLTAISNDYSFDKVFARQVEAHLRMGDVLWLLSTSGASPNILEAARAARDRGGKVLAFTGAAGKALADLADVCFMAPAKQSYSIQQLHQVAYHIVCDVVEREAESFA